MAGWECNDLVAYVLQAFDLGGEEDCVGVGGYPTLIEGSYADRIPGRNNAVSSVAHVVQYEAEESVQFFGAFEIRLIVLESDQRKRDMYKMKNDFTVRVSFELVFFL